MSYCRWSCDNFRSDVYAYEARDGYYVHVAGNRIMQPLPQNPLETLLQDSPEETVRKYRKWSAVFDDTPRVPIDLPYVGETFVEHTLADLKARLAGLQALGYHVPDHAFALVDEEMEAAP